MTIGIWVVIVALAPAIIGSYGVAGHQLWLVCSLLALALLVAMIVVFGRAPENRADVVETLASTPRVPLMVVVATTFWLPVVLLVLALVLVVLGALPDKEQALYVTAVGLGLYMGAMGLLAAVFSQRRPGAATDQATPPAAGG